MAQEVHQFGQADPSQDTGCQRGCPLTLPPELVCEVWVSSQQHQASPNGVARPGQGRKQGSCSEAWESGAGELGFTIREMVSSP